ncbi:hypothetical protein ACSSS7_008249 [Eimeria intestinalis]
MAMELPTDLPPSQLASIIRDCVMTFSERGRQSIVFVATKAMADQLAHAGTASSGLMFSSAVLHGGIEQETREKVMHGFRQGRYKALICTDVAARGIDVANVDLVVHCGIAFDSDVFIHRSGRTGRAGRRGLSLLLFTPQEKRELQRLQKTCGIRFEPRDLPTVDEVLEAASESVSRRLDEVSPSLMPFFSTAAADILQRAEAVGVSPQDVVARALAVAAGFKDLPSRSLLSLHPGVRTIELVKERGSWVSAEEADSWLAKQMLHWKEAPHEWRVGAPREHADDPSRVYLDVRQESLQAILSIVNDTSKHKQTDFVVSVHLPSKRPPLAPLRGTFRSRRIDEGRGGPTWRAFPSEGSGRPPHWIGAHTSEGRAEPFFRRSFLGRERQRGRGRDGRRYLLGGGGSRR